MTTAQVVETSVTVNNNSPIQDYVHPDDQTQPFEILYKVCNVKISPEQALIFYFHCVAQYTLSVDSLSSGLKALRVCRL